MLQVDGLFIFDHINEKVTTLLTGSVILWHINIFYAFEHGLRVNKKIPRAEFRNSCHTVKILQYW